MAPKLSASLVTLMVIFGCGGTRSPSAPSNLPIVPGSPPSDISDAKPVVTAISPAAIAAGSAETTLSVNGSNFAQTLARQAVIRWTTAAGGKVYLSTRFVSSTEVSAVIPGTLLKTEGTAEIAVVNGDLMGIADGFIGYPTSNAVVFTITANPPAVYVATLTASASCAAVLPSTARERTYTATFLSDGRINWTGPTLRPPPGHGTISSGTFSDDVLNFSIDVDRDPMSDDFHGLWDTMDAGTFLNISGKAKGSMRDGEITGVLDGLFAFFEPVGNPNVLIVGRYCRATDHRFTLVTAHNQSDRQS